MRKSEIMKNIDQEIAKLDKKIARLRREIIGHIIHLVIYTGMIVFVIAVMVTEIRRSKYPIHVHDTETVSIVKRPAI